MLVPFLKMDISVPVEDIPAEGRPQRGRPQRGHLCPFLLLPLRSFLLYT